MAAEIAGRENGSLAAVDASMRPRRMAAEIALVGVEAVRAIRLQ